MFEIENMLLDGILASPNKYFDVCGSLKVDDFSTQPGRVVYLTIEQLFKGGKEVNWKTVYANVPENYKSFVVGLTDGGFPVPSSVGELSSKVIEASRKRRILEAAEKMKKDAAFSDSDTLLADIARIYANEMRQTSKECDSKNVVNRFLQKQATNRTAGRLGWSFNITSLDREYIQLRPGNLMVIGGFTSVGKTALMVELIRRFGKIPHIIVFSTEMTETDITARLIANCAGLNANKVLAGKLEEYQWSIQAKATEEIKNFNLHIYDHIFDINQIEQETRRLKLQGKCDIVFIDFFQNIQCPGKSKYEKSADLAVRLQQFMLQNGIACICLSQISNDAAKNDSGNVEYKGAGEIAAACDIGVWIRRVKEDERMLLWETRKNRHGSKPTFYLRYKEEWEGLEEWTA